jgi:hypothetical protein
VSQQSKKSVDYTDRISKKSSEKEMGSGKKDCNLKGKGKRKIVKNSNKKNVASLTYNEHTKIHSQFSQLSHQYKT